MTATVHRLVPPASPDTPARDSFLTELAAILAPLGPRFGAPWCRAQADAQPRNREAWERTATLLELRQDGPLP